MDDARRTLERDTVAALYRQALTFADDARALILDALERGFTVKQKPDGSFVTDADLRVEERLRARITDTFPDHGILGEEFPAHNPEAPFQWILDPIDGTEDFVHRVPTFGSIIALYYRDQPLVGVLDHPALDMRASAGFGLGAYYNDARVQLTDPAPPPDSARLVLSARANFVRYRDAGDHFDRLVRVYPNHRIYRSCFGQTLVAIGKADAMVDYHDRAWDLAAVPILVTEAGGAYRLLHEFVAEGAPVRSVVFGSTRLVHEIAAMLPNKTTSATGP